MALAVNKALLEITFQQATSKMLTLLRIPGILCFAAHLVTGAVVPTPQTLEPTQSLNATSPGGITSTVYLTPFIAPQLQNC